MGRVNVNSKKKRPVKTGMTDKQRMFVATYVTNGYNGTKAAIEAGYPAKTAQVMASKLMHNPLVASALKKVMGNTLKKKGLEREAILERVADNLHRDLTDLADDDGIIYSDLRKIPKRAHAFIDGLDVKQIYGQDGEVVGQTIRIRLSPNAAIQDMAMKFIGAYAPEKQQHTLGIDWDSLCMPTTEPSDMEKKLAAIEVQANEVEMPQEGDADGQS